MAKKERLFEIIELNYAGFGKSSNGKSNCTVNTKIKVNGKVFHEAGEGAGVVNAFDIALRKIIKPFFPDIDSIKLKKYISEAVNIEESGSGAKVKTSVIVGYNGFNLNFEHSDTDSNWSGCIALAKGINTCLNEFVK